MITCPKCGASLPEGFGECNCDYRFASRSRVSSAPVTHDGTAEKRDRILLGVISLYLVFTFVRRLSPVDELPSASVNLLAALSEIAMFIGVSFLGSRVLRAAPTASPGRGKWIAVFVIGLVAGVGVLAIRWSGGQRVQPRLSPRTASTIPEAVPKSEATIPGAAPKSDSTIPGAGPKNEVAKPWGIAGFERLTMATRFRTQVEELNRRMEATTTGRWPQLVQSNDPSKTATLTREDLLEYRQVLRALVKTLDDGVKLFADAEAKRINLADFSVDEPAFTRLEVWRAFREAFSFLERYHTLVEANWEDYRVSGIKPAHGEPKPWQVEAMRMSAEGDALQKEANEAWLRQK